MDSGSVEGPSIPDEILRVAMGQFSARADAEWNLKQIRALTQAAHRDGADLVVFPENAQYFFDEGADAEGIAPQVAEDIGGPFTRAMDDLANEAGLVVVVGMLESGPDRTKPFNTVYVTNGKKLGTYRKVHMYDAFGFRESDIILASPDAAPTIVSIKGTQVGIITCYDLRFPESSGELAAAGATVLLVPSAWASGPRKEDHWNVLVRARAIENTCYVVAVNQSPPNGTAFSLAVDPMGVIVAELQESATLRTVDLDLRRIDAVRANNPSLANRRFVVSRRAALGPEPGTPKL